MRPGTVHTVLTVRDSVSVGGMFYHQDHYEATLRTIIALHLNGQRLTNSFYPGTHALLFHSLGYYYENIRSSGLLLQTSEASQLNNMYSVLERGESILNFGRLPTQHDYNCSDEQVPAIRQLAALCIAVKYSSSLTAQQSENEEVKRWLRGYRADRTKAVSFAESILDHIIQVIDKESYNELESLVKAALKAQPNRQQRDLPEVGDIIKGKFGFCHDNEHEYRVTEGEGIDPDPSIKAPWDGPQGTFYGGG